jgi:hypothetical protein
MAGSPIVSIEVAQAIAKFVAARALAPLVGNLVMGNLVNRDYEPTLAQAGDTVNIAIPPTLTANNLLEGGNVVPQNPNLGNSQVVLNRHAEATFTIPDATKVLTVPNLLDVYMQPAVIAIAEQIETDLLAQYTKFTANATCGGATAMDEARIDLAETELFTAKVPAAAPRYLVVSGSAYSSMRQLSRFTEFQMTGPSGQPSPIITGMLTPGTVLGASGGTIKSATVYRSQYVSVVSSTYQNIMFSRDGLGLVIRRLPQPIPGTGAIAEYAELGNFGVRVVMSYQSQTLAQQFTVDCLYGINVVRNNFGVIVQST